MFIFLVGCVSYGMIEILFRGFTHWSMVLTGGACLVSLYYINLSIKNAPITIKAIIGALVITFYEFAVGLIVNKWYGFNVWDYSTMKGNCMGLICPLFTMLWFYLCFILATAWFLFYNITNSRIKKNEEMLYASEEL
ncbi:MAG: hypothetical protein PHX63_04525 [Eubacteriales bacterium]|nr:hypothetical protein [Eubacteriales bacterium]